MPLSFEHEFVVKAAAETVWSYLTDPYRVAPALPGAAITEKVDDRTYKGTLTVKVGPVSARYRGTLRFEALDPVARTAQIAASGQDVSGRGGADMKMTSRLAEQGPAETQVKVVSEVNVTGILAQFGRGLMQDVSNQMFQRFTEAVRAELEHPLPAATGATVLAVSDRRSADEAASSAAEASPPMAAAPPIEVLSFGSSIAGRAVVRALRQPAVWIAAALAVLVVYWWLSR